ncbi:MAG: DUF2793 domain-containing protein [Hyphomonadaceae bacterium]
MSDRSSNLGLPFLAQGQAQKHVTVNESLLHLDALVQLAVVSAATAAQPASPSDGAVYILPSGKSGDAWSTMADGALAYYRDGVWEEIAPREGFAAFVKDADQIVIYTGAAWVALASALRVSASDKLLGRISSGAGAAEEVSFTDQAQQLCDDTSFAAMRTTLGAAGLADANVFTGEPQTIQAASLPGLRLYRTDSGADARDWRIETGSSDRMFFDTYNDAGVFVSSAMILTRAGVLSVLGGVNPSSDNAVDLGSASLRWNEVYAATGAIQTSDAREKTPLAPIPDSVKRAVRKIMAGVGVFQWRDALAEKGEAARFHIGVTAQAVAAAFAQEGEDAARWALFCADEIEDPLFAETHTRLSLRYDQLFALALATLADQVSAGPA